MYGLKEALRLGNGEGVKHAPHVGPAVWIPYRREHPHLRDMHGELDILAIEAVEAEDVFVHSFASD